MFDAIRWLIIFFPQQGLLQEKDTISGRFLDPLRENLRRSGNFDVERKATQKGP